MAAATLLIGSMSVASAYQARLQAMTATGELVRGEMADRIIDAAAILPADHFARAFIVLSPDERVRVLQALLAPVMTAMAPTGILELSEVHQPDPAATELLSAAFASVDRQGDSIVAKGAKPSAARPAQVDGAAVPLRLKTRGTASAKKASLWAFTQDPDGTSTPTIDESALLTPQDLERRETVQRPDCDVKRTRKACKNCSCGLRELLLQEKDDLPNGAASKPSAMPEIENGDVEIVGTGEVTSSCGSCYLGDAFRCSSCPYLGLPAFEPGQKVELPADFSDM